MKTKGFTVTTAIILTMDILCVAICARQTAYLISFQDIFAAEHPAYVSHSWILLTLLLVPALLACGQAVLSRGRGRRLLCGSMSVAMIVLEVLALRAAADQHYHMGMLISDYGLQMPFNGGWLLLILVVTLLIATVTQLLMVLFSALTKHTEM